MDGELTLLQLEVSNITYSGGVRVFSLLYIFKEKLSISNMFQVLVQIYYKIYLKIEFTNV
jgi:hypothetical protein